jgi:hypothetical protein
VKPLVLGVLLFAFAATRGASGGTGADVTNDFHVVLPDRQREFPEPLPAGASPGFKIRGTKGWAWTPEQYLAEIPYLAKVKMNFIMNCYVSMFDIEHHANWGDGGANRWWEDLPSGKKEAYEKVVRSAQRHGLQFCFSMNPNLLSKRTVNELPDGADLLFKHFAWMQGLGVKWFNLSLDDATNGVNAVSQARVVNEIFHRLRAKDGEAQMIFCPTYYWGDGTAPLQQPYLETLAPALDRDIYVFWTGDDVVGRITRKAADSFRRISGHRIILWDNYPVNDGQPTLHLGPLTGRDPDLCDVVDGYMSNPMHEQNEINRIPLGTCADYAWNPRAYDPMRSIGQSIMLQAGKRSQRELLREWVDAYPGMRPGVPFSTGFNPVRAKMDLILARPQSRPAAIAYVDQMRRLLEGVTQEFPGQYGPAKKTLAADIAILEQKLKRIETN